MKKSSDRSKISRFIPYDIRLPEPLNLKGSSTSDELQFDIVSSTGCLEAAVKSDIEYCEAVANLSKLLKPGGHLVMAWIFNYTFYMVGDQAKKFANFPLSESLIRRAFDEA